MSEFAIGVIFFVYGLAFFGMGLATAIESDRAGETSVRRALLTLAVFGIMHGTHEWYDMFEILGLIPLDGRAFLIVIWVRIVMLAISFAVLAYFGMQLIIAETSGSMRPELIPGILFAAWALAVFIAGRTHPQAFLPHLGDVLARHMIAIPGAILAAIGLRIQCISYHRQKRFILGKNCTWAAIAFLVYGVIGQFFVRETILFPSSVVNQATFLEWFHFPIQLLRALSAVVIAFFIVRLLRAFEKEIRVEMSKLQRSRLKEARRREDLRGELLKRVVDAQEAERQRIARELHDETGQGLTAIGMGLRGLSGMLDKDKLQTKETLRHLEKLVDHTLGEIQHIIADLRPSHLDDLGLAAALRWYAGQVNERTGLDVQVQVDGEPHEIDMDVKMTLFRIAQEALTNVVKHAAAQKARILLEFHSEDVSITIEDDGCGFNVEWINLPTQATWGLIGMQERATLLGGQFMLNSDIGVGTRIKVVIPYNGKRDADGKDETSAG